MNQIREEDWFFTVINVDGEKICTRLSRELCKLLVNENLVDEFPHFVKQAYAEFGGNASISVGDLIQSKKVTWMKKYQFVAWTEDGKGPDGEEVVALSVSLLKEHEAAVESPVLN